MEQRETHDNIPPLPKDTLTIGKFEFFGVPDEDRFADVICIKQKQLGMTFQTTAYIDSLLRLPLCDRTPTHRDQIEAFVFRCIEEEYIVSLCHVIENDFDDEDDNEITLTGVWKQAYAYRTIPDPIIRVPKVQKFCRLIVLDVPKENADEGEHVLGHVLRYYREQTRRRKPVPYFESKPKSVRRRNVG